MNTLKEERDAFRVAFCNGPAYDTGETPEQARERWDKQAFIEGVSAVIVARELAKELAAERAKVDKLRDAMGELIEGIDILTPDAPVAIEGTIMGNAKKALAETATKEDGK